MQDCDKYFHLLFVITRFPPKCIDDTIIIATTILPDDKTLIEDNAGTSILIYSITTVAGALLITCIIVTIATSIIYCAYSKHRVEG